MTQKTAIINSTAINAGIKNDISDINSITRTSKLYFNNKRFYIFVNNKNV